MANLIEDSRLIQTEIYDEMKILYGLCHERNRGASPSLM